MITWEDFEKLDIRLGTIVSAEIFPAARKPAYKLTIDFGALGIKQSSAQITHYYKPEDLLQKQVVAVINFPPKNIAGFMSQCLVLGVYDVQGHVVLLSPERHAQNGAKAG
ncbi:MAG: tRNA-binding protein [Ferruginibacter sp.]